MVSNSRVMVKVASLERQMEAKRQIIYEAVIALGGIPVGLPFPALPANYLLKLNQQCLADADYLFLLVGSEYGAITEKGISYLHQTYASAKAMRKPVVAFVYKGSDIASNDPLDARRLQGFRASLSTETVYYWSNEEELRDAVERGFEHITEQHPASGWSKSDLDIRMPDSYHQETDLIAKLKQQVGHLKSRLEQHLHGSSQASLDFTKDPRPWVFHYSCNAFREGRLRQMNGEHSIAIDEVYLWLSGPLLSPLTESRVVSIISGRLHAHIMKQVKSQWHGSHAISDIKIAHDSVDILKKRLKAMQAIDLDPHGRWYLTPAGEQWALQPENIR